MSRFQFDFARINETISIVMVLQRNNINPVRRRGNEYFYLCPWRDESIPSLTVRVRENRWHDFGTGEDGSVIDLVIRLGIAAGPKAAAGYLLRFDGMIPFTPLADNAATKSTGSGEILSVGPIENTMAARYLEEVRGIPCEIAQRYVSFVRYMIPTSPSRLFGIGWQTMRGGWAIRWPKDLGAHKGKHFVGPAGISLVKVTEGRRTASLAVFEGMLDFLAFLVLQGVSQSVDVIVMNSCGNLYEALNVAKQYDHLDIYLDNDDSGRQTTGKLMVSLQGRVTDHSAEYLPYNDVNDFLRKKRRDASNNLSKT